MAASALRLVSSAPRARLGFMERLFTPIDPASIVFFRVAFGLIVAWEMWRYLDPSNDWVYRYYQQPDFLFKYAFFDWVEPLPGVLLPLAFIVIGIAGVLVAVGLLYRVSAAVVFLGLSYVFLLDKARYLNHWYMMILVAFLMVLIPAARACSIDARLMKRDSSTVPAWSLWLLRFQFAVPYFFGGIAKLNGDWLQGEPIATWLAAREEFPLVGAWFQNRAFGVAVGYAALLFDLSIVFLLLNQRTRRYGLLLALFFNLANDRLFSIGVFPWLMLAGTLLFLDPDWPRQIMDDFRTDNRRMVNAFVLGAVAGLIIGATFPDVFGLMKSVVTGLVVGVVVYEFVALVDRDPQPKPVTEHTADRAGFSKLVAGFVVVWVAIQVLVPLRHLVIPGNVHWTEEGHRYAWHMKLRDKEAEASFVILEPDSGRFVVLDPSQILTDRQADRVASRPDMAVQFAHHLEAGYMTSGQDDLVVMMDGWASLNYRKPQRLIDPMVDLTTIRTPWIPPANWIVPLEQPLITG